MAQFRFIYPPLKGDAAEFNRRDCCTPDSCSCDFLDILIAGYNTLYRTEWENCLNAKWSIADCVSGCHNPDCLDGIPECKQHFLRNGHQYCVATQAIKDVVKIIEPYDFTDDEVRTFDTFYTAIHTAIKDVNGMGALAIYDTALRLGWHRAEGRLEPEANVYLHAGAPVGRAGPAARGPRRRERLCGHRSRYRRQNPEAQYLPLLRPAERPWSQPPRKLLVHLPQSATVVGRRTRKGNGKRKGKTT